MGAEVGRDIANPDSVMPVSLAPPGLARGSWILVRHPERRCAVLVFGSLTKRKALERIDDVFASGQACCNLHFVVVQRAPIAAMEITKGSVAKRIGAFGLDGERRPVVAGRLFIALQFEKRIGAAVQGGGATGIGGERFFVTRQCLVKAAKREQRRAAIDEGFQNARAKLQHPVVALDSVSVTTELGEHIAAV